MSWRILEGDCIERMRELDANSIDAIVTDPPYGIGFMGKEWDGFTPAALARKTANHQPIDHKKQSGRSASMHAGQYDLSTTGNHRFQAWCETWAREALRVLKPGGHLLAFGGTRTYHRLAAAIEDAGFEIRDTLAWLYGSGFPKSLDVSKAIDKAAGAEREVERIEHRRGRSGGIMGAETSIAREIGAPATDEAREWQGWGTALKPAYEPIVLARKPLAERTVAGNVLEHGTGALNIDACRIHTPGSEAKPYRVKRLKPGATLNKTGGNWRPEDGGVDYEGATKDGRWPANVLLDQDAAAILDQQSGESRSTASAGRNGRDHGDVFAFGRAEDRMRGHDDRGGASRFFYTAKTSTAERNVGGIRNTHPTVKPVELMQWLCRLVTPKGGLILDPFTGSGSTGMAALREGFAFLGIEREPEYVQLARARIVGDAPLFNQEGDSA